MFALVKHKIVRLEWNLIPINYVIIKIMSISVIVKEMKKEVVCNDDS